MPDALHTVLGAPCWIDLSTSDTARTAAFYSGVFGWEAEVGDLAGPGGSVLFRKAGKEVAGAMRKDAADTSPDGWTTYLHVADAVATGALVTAAGGQNLFEPVEAGEMGWAGFARDPGGAAIGFWQPLAHRGYDLFGEAGAAVWLELHTRDFAASVAFYEQAFGWSTEAADGAPRYSRYMAGGQPQAGIMDATGHLAPGEPASWRVYFGVTDVDATIERALALGGSLVHPAEDTPFGRLAGLTDSTGASFAVASVDG